MGISCPALFQALALYIVCARTRPCVNRLCRNLQWRQTGFYLPYQDESWHRRRPSLRLQRRIEQIGPFALILWQKDTKTGQNLLLQPLSYRYNMWGQNELTV